MTLSRFSLLLFLIFFSIKANAVDDVKTQKLSELIVYPNFQFPAHVIALNNIMLSSEMVGIIASKPLAVGTYIKQNQTLVRIDCTDNELAKEQAIAALKRLQVQKKLDQQQLTRARQLVQVKSISKQELDQKQTALDASIASLEQQNVALKIIDRTIKKCTIKAPFSGVITENNALKGSYVTPGSPLLSLLDPKAVEVEVTLPIKLATHLSTLKSISFKQGQNVYAVNVRAIVPMVNSKTKQQLIRLSLENSQTPLANSIGTLLWQGQQATIPSQYVVQRKGQLGLFVAEQGQAFFKPLVEAVEGQNSSVNYPQNTLIITNKLLILKDKDSIN